MIHAYQEAGLWVKPWRLDEPWHSSRLWLAGADSVTSSNIQALIAMPRPMMATADTIYRMLWCGMAFLAAAICFRRKRA